MNLVDYIDFVLSLIRLKHRRFDKFTDIIDARITRSVDLDNIEEGAIFTCITVYTGVARISLSEVETVDPLCEDTSARRLSSPTHTMKEICTSDSIGGESISQDCLRVFLTDNTFPVMRPIEICE